MKPFEDRAGGFSLVELLFAVILLGFGLMGIAATLSVSAGMTQSNVDEAAAARVAETASSMLAQCMTDANFPSTSGALQSFTAAQYQAVQRQMLSASDRRFAWIPMYRRDDDSRVAQLVIAVIRAKAQSEYTLTDATPDAVNHAATLIPTAVKVSLSDPSLGPVTATFGDPAHPDNRTQIVAPDALVILNADPPGNEAGRIYKVGNVVDAANNVWSLAPGFDAPGNYEGSAFVIGRGYADNTNPAKGYEGPSQAVAAYATFVMLK